MVTYQTRITISASINEVYRLISNHERAKEWITGLKSLEIKEGQANEVGSITEYVFHERGKDVVFREELLSIKPNSHFSFRLDSEHVIMETETRLKPLGTASTEVMMSNAIKGKGLLMKIMMPLMKKTMITRQQNDLTNLKKLLEQ